MKRFLVTLTLAATMMTSISGFAGGETSGGGDAVYVEDQLVLRDFMGASSFETVINNEKYLRSIPDFKELLGEISQANTQLAAKIYADLVKVPLFLSRQALPLLPASTTAMSGPHADVQLAIRTKNEILLHPKFLKVKDASYVMIHEALHSILKDNIGPMHHHRVRNIVKYLKDNRGNYDSEELAILLNKNQYNEKFTLKLEIELNETLVHVLNDELSQEIRCGLTYLNESLRTFLKLTCLPEHNRQKYFQDRGFENIPTRGKLSDINYTYKAYYQEGPTIVPLKLEPTGMFDTQKKREQKYDCWENREILNTAKDYLIRIKEYTEETKVYEDLLETLNTADKKYVLSYLGYTKFDFKDFYEKVEKSIQIADKNIAVGEANDELCVAKFKNKF